MGASHAVDRDVVPLLNVKLYAIESACDGEVAAGNMGEVTLDPFGICRDGKLKGSRAMVGDFGGLFGVSGAAKQVTTSLTSGNCVGCRLCWQAPR